MKLNKKQEAKIIKVIELGHEIEAHMYNRKFVGYDGFDNVTINKNIKKARAKLDKLILGLLDEGVDVYDMSYTHEDANGVSWELDYALQF